MKSSGPHISDEYDSKHQVIENYISAGRVGDRVLMPRVEKRKRVMLEETAPVGSEQLKRDGVPVPSIPRSEGGEPETKKDCGVKNLMSEINKCKEEVAKIIMDKVADKDKAIEYVTKLHETDVQKFVSTFRSIGVYMLHSRGQHRAIVMAMLAKGGISTTDLGANKEDSEAQIVRLTKMVETIGNLISKLP